MNVDPLRASRRTIAAWLLLVMVLVGAPLTTPVARAASIVPTISWPVPTPIVYGTALSSTQLGASATASGVPVLGQFVYNPPLGSVLNAGTHTLQVSFQPLNLSLYGVATASVQLQVNPAPLSVTANAASRVYGAANPSLTATTTGFVNGDSSNLLSGALSTNATTTSSVGAYTISQGTLGAANYAITFNPGTLTITKAPLTIGVNTETRKVGQANPAFTLTYSGLVNGESANVLAVAPQATTAATMNSPVGTYDITVSGGAAANYSLNYVNGVLQVTAKDIPTLTWNTPAAITYGTALNATQLNATASIAGTFAYNPPLNTLLGVGTHTIQASFTPNDLLNFVPVVKTVQVQVTPAPLTVTADAATRVYGDANPALTVHATGFVNGETLGVVSGDVATTADPASSVGSYPITQGTLSAVNYAVTFMPGTLTITKATLGVQVDNETRKVSSPNPAFTLHVNGFANNQTVADLQQLPQASTTATVNSAVGTYPITISGGAATNYNFSYGTGTLTITAKDVPLLDWNAPATITYGTPLSSAQLNASAALNGVAVAGQFVYSPSMDTVLDAGDHTLSVAFQPLDSALFAPVTQSVNLHVDKAPLTVKAEAASRLYGASNPPLTFTTTGLVNSDTPGIVMGNLATSANVSSDVGAYAITQGSLNALNYALTVITNTLDVTKAPLLVTGYDRTRKIGEANPAFTFGFAGFVNGDTAADLDVVPQALTSADENSPAGVYAITLSGGVAQNYDLTYLPGILTVTPKDVPQLNWNTPATITYGTPLSSAQLNASVLLPGTISYDPPMDTVLDAGTHTLTATFTPLDGITYATVTTSVPIVVTKAPLAITVNDQTRTYGTPNPNLTFNATGFVQSEDASALSGKLTTDATINSPAGAYPITIGSLDAVNYALSLLPGTLTITKAPLVVTADSFVREANTPNPALTLSYAGFVNGDTVSDLDVSPQATTTANENSALGVYPITVGGGADGNYTFVYVPGTLTVTNLQVPHLAWNMPAAITYGTPLGAAQLNATATLLGTAVDGSVSYDPPAGTVLPAGTHTLRATFTPLDGTVYASVTANVQIVVTKAPLTVTANNITSAAGNTLPDLTFTTNGFVNNDTAATALTGELATSATRNSPAGSYAITQGTLSASNYAISFVPGTVTITPAPAAGPTLTTTSPSVGRPGSVFVLQASGFTPGAMVNVTLNKRLLDMLPVNNDGSISFGVHFPAGFSAGGYTLVMQEGNSATGVSAGKAAQTTVTLDPNASLLTAPNGIPIISAAYRAMLSIVIK